MNLMLHCTNIDAYLWYQRLESMSATDLVDRLKRTAAPNRQMELGTAWHSILENPPSAIDEISSGGFTFKVDCDASISIPQIREIKAAKTYFVDGINVTLTGGCDGISGNKVTDHKLTFRPQPENYFDSYQWRAYLDIYNADVFEYIIYSAKEKSGVVSIYDISIMKMYRYPEMVNDLESGIRELVGFIKDHCPEMVDGFKDDILRMRRKHG